MDAAANTPKPLVVWFMVIDFLMAAVLVFVGVKIGMPGAVLVWVFAAVFVVIGFLQGWAGFRRG